MGLLEKVRDRMKEMREEARRAKEAERKLTKKEALAVDTDKKVDFSNIKSRILIKLAKAAVKTHFSLYAKAIGLHDYEIPNMEKLATLSEEYYTLDCEGGEGHLEVAHRVGQRQSITPYYLSQTIWVYAKFGCK